MNKAQIQQVLDALSINRVMAKDSDGNYTREVTPKLITAAIALCEAELARVMEPVAIDAAELDPAPPNSLPTWDECAIRVDNSDLSAKSIAEGGYGYEGSMYATELHRFIYEYDDSDPYESAWFLHRLELLLNEVRATPQVAAQPSQAVKAQEPLTEEVLKDIWVRVCGTAAGYGPFARAIEAAHGIGGQQP